MLREILFHNGWAHVMEPSLPASSAWPHLNPGENPSLASKAAEYVGWKPESRPRKRWIRYYGEEAPWPILSFKDALNESTNYFTDKIIFIGNEPKNPFPDNEEDKLSIPYTRWTQRAVGGVQIQIAEFLNLINGEWLELPPTWAEILMLLVTSLVLLLCLSGNRLVVSCFAAFALAIVFAFSNILLSYYTNYWFPWLIVSGGQVPCAFAWAVFAMKSKTHREVSKELTKTVKIDSEESTKVQFPADKTPAIPDYQLIEPAFGAGGFGKVWLAKSAIGQWQAIKVVFREKFGEESYPYDAEFNGVQRYKPVSERHPGLLRVEFVSTKRPEGFFFYIMELGDSRNANWTKDPALYKPKDLDFVRKNAPDKRLSVNDCLRICIPLAETLDFLHKQGLTHRDIKPSNVIFVNGQPKLADVGLVSEARMGNSSVTIVGTMGYMPPAPERPGSPQADIYAFGMLIYVISTGSDPRDFPGLSTTLVERSKSAEFLMLDKIILKACAPDISNRYQTVAEMLRDLKELSESLMSS